MVKVTYSIVQFDLKKFLTTALEEGKSISKVPLFLVDQINSFDFESLFDDYENADVDKFYDGLMAGKYLYVNFSDTGVNYPDIACIDGNKYQTIQRDEVEEYFEEEAVPDNFVFTEGLVLGEESSLGYILQFKNDLLTIQSAQFFIDTIQIKEDVEVFEKPMKDFLNRFLK